MNPRAENECHCRVKCPMPEGDAYEGDHEITFCPRHNREDLQPGSRVRVVQDHFVSTRNGGSLVGYKGIVRSTQPSRHRTSLCVDVALDQPAPMDRFYLWFSECELEVLHGRTQEATPSI